MASQTTGSDCLEHPKDSAVAASSTAGAPTVPVEVLCHADSAPDRVAVTDHSGSITYRDLVERASALAASLRSALNDVDDSTEPVVAVLWPRTAEAVVAQLAAWFCGAAFLPLDPGLPATRIRDILTWAGCRVATVHSGLVDALPPNVTPVVADNGHLISLAATDRLAYVISTSGSTGKPKQVEIEHRSLAGTLSWYARFFGLGPGVRTAAFAGLAFDACLLDLWAPLMAGATVLLADEKVVRDPDLIAATFREVDHSFLATPLAEQLLRSNVDTGRLRTLATGGDRLRIWPPTDFGAAVHNLYGPTEATILVTATGDLRTGRDRSAPPPIGRPVAGAELTLDLPAARPGDEGELLIAGSGLARGYRDAPRETAAAFVAAPDPATRRYRSGDICRWTADGELSFVRRVDGQVKIRGNRIELREVELALLDVPRVTQAAADVTHRAGEALLTAWVAGPVDAEQVGAHLRHRLPASMVPGRLEVLTALPLTVNGKLDRAALRAMSAIASEDAAPASAEPAASGSPARRSVTQAWRTVLGSAPGPDDDFFLTGGDSLLAVRLTTYLRRELGIELKSSLLYEHRCFADYLAEIEALHAEQTTGPPAGAGLVVGRPGAIR
jgi:amino acid adenylation domain-containing protein